MPIYLIHGRYGGGVTTVFIVPLKLRLKLIEKMVVVDFKNFHNFLNNFHKIYILVIMLYIIIFWQHISHLYRT